MGVQGATRRLIGVFRSITGGGWTVMAQFQLCAERSFNYGGGTSSQARIDVIAPPNASTADTKA